MINFSDNLKLALTGNTKALQKIEKEIEQDKLSHEEIKYLQQLVTDNNLKGNSYAFYLAGLAYYQQENYVKAAALFEQAIELDNTNNIAMTYRGSMYLNGKGGPVDYSKAIAFFDKAIVPGNVPALTYRAAMYDRGLGEPLNYAKAIALYDKAIVRGSASAMNNRADMHSKGQGGPVDYSKATALLNKAIKLGDRFAMHNRALMHYKGEGGPVDYPKAIALFDKAIKLGHSSAMATRAFMHHEGLGGPVDYAKAIGLLDEAIALDDALAMIYRADMHQRGQEGPVDNDAAAYLYRKAYLLEKNDESREVAKTELQLVTSQPRAKYHWAMVTGQAEFTKLIEQNPQHFLRFLAEDNLLSPVEKYPYVKKILNEFPNIKAKVKNQTSIALLEAYFKAQASTDEDTQVSPLMSLDASIWLYLVSCLSRADKASLRLVCQFFLRNMLSSPSVWQQWVDVDEIDMFQEQGKRFGWGRRPIYGAFFSSCTSLPNSLPPVTALDFSRSAAFFKASSDELVIFFAKLPKQLTYLKLQYAANITLPVIRFLMEIYPDLYIDFAGNNLLFWSCYLGWQDIVVTWLEQMTSQQGPFAKLKLDPLSKSGRGSNALTPPMIAKQQGHIEIVKLLDQHAIINTQSPDKDEIQLSLQRLQNAFKNTENILSHTGQNIIFSTKIWSYEMAEKIAYSHHAARNMAYQITLWLEYLALTPSLSFSQEVGTRYTQLFALLLIDIYLEAVAERKRCPTQNLMDLAAGEFSKPEINQLKNELHALQLPHVVAIKPIIEVFEKILHQVPQTKTIKMVARSILDAFNLKFFSILGEKEKICAAILAVARFDILKKQEEAWPHEYVMKTKMTLDSFKGEYDLISQLIPVFKKTMAQKYGAFFASTKSNEASLTHTQHADAGLNSYRNGISFQ